MIKRILKYAGLVILVILGLFLIWFKFSLSEYDEFKNSTCFEHRKRVSTDGPYILYNNDSVRIVSVEEESRGYKIIDEWFAKSKFAQNFIVNSYSYDKSSQISFKVSLKDTLTIPPSYYPKTDSIFAISDIEGNLYAFHKLLKANRIIDNNSNWIFGKGHLVLVGDFVDRGLNVTQCLWLIYKLEQQAKDNGGRVHYILGNHELLNRNGKSHHVRSKYKKLASKLGLDYSKDFYGEKSELGRWLRTKNTVEIIGDILIVNGGISKELLDLRLSIEEINSIIRDEIGLNNYLDSTSRIIHGENGPLNDRGMGHKQSIKTSLTIEMAKEYYSISTLIIGHSTVSDIYQQYENSLINIDVHFPHNDSDVKRGKGLLIESGTRYKVDDIGNKNKI